MSLIYIVDDESIYHRMLVYALKPSGYQLETFLSGQEALDAAKDNPPHLIITDVMMPDLDGYELTRRFRRQPGFAQTPILVLTAQAELEDKIKAFEAGADDYMSKPFEPAELAARVKMLLSQLKAHKVAHEEMKKTSQKAKVIAIHSLRGGTGCTSLSVNLALGLRALWGHPTLLFDAVLTVGQVALMLNGSLKRTWADIARLDTVDLDFHAMQSITIEHDSGIHFIAAPTSPLEVEQLSGEKLKAALDALHSRYEYIVLDTGHDFGEVSMQALDSADTIVMVLTPEMASLRASAAALDVYSRLGYDKEKLMLVLNRPFETQGMTRKQIEQVLHHPIQTTIPFSSGEFLNAINLGRPILQNHLDTPIGERLERFAYLVSKDQHKTNSPVNPSETLIRVQRKLQH